MLESKFIDLIKSTYKVNCFNCNILKKIRRRNISTIIVEKIVKDQIDFMYHWFKDSFLIKFTY